MIYKNKLKEKFLKIISLPKRKSDNYSRVKRIIEFKKFNFRKKKSKSFGYWVWVRSFSLQN